MTDQESLGLRAVAERFEESAAQLDQLRDRINALALAEDTQRRAADALDTSAAQLSSLVAELRAVVEHLHAAQATAQAALDVARTTLESTDVRQLRDELASLRADLHNGMNVLAAQIGDAEQARQRYDELAAKVARVPARARRKAGVDL